MGVSVSAPPAARPRKVHVRTGGRFTKPEPLDFLLRLGTHLPRPCSLASDTRFTTHDICCILALIPSRSCTGGVLQCPQKQKSAA